VEIVIAQDKETMLQKYRSIANEDRKKFFLNLKKQNH